MKKSVLNIVLACLVLSFALVSCGERYKELTEREERSVGRKAASEVGGDFSESDTAAITHLAYLRTSEGEIVIGLYGEDAPETVANFIGLAKMGYYDGVLFHRVAKNFLIQTGDRTTLFPNRKKQWGYGGESFYGGTIDDELNPETPSYKRGYEYGTVAMANRGPNTNASQFFICLKEAKNLEKKWTIFGRVVKGMDVVEKIASLPVEPSDRGPDDGVPKKPVRIYSARIKLIKPPREKR